MRPGGERGGRGDYGLQAFSGPGSSPPGPGLTGAAGGWPGAVEGAEGRGAWWGVWRLLTSV